MYSYIYITSTSVESTFVFSAGMSGKDSAKVSPELAAAYDRVSKDIPELFASTAPLLSPTHDSVSREATQDVKLEVPSPREPAEGPSHFLSLHCGVVFL